MKRQITNKELQDALKLYDENFIIQLGIGEESTLATHLFIDSDNGVIDITDFEDVDETKVHFEDMFSNTVYEGSSILYIDENTLHKGQVLKINEFNPYADNSTNAIVTIAEVIDRTVYKDKLTLISVSLSDYTKNNKIIKFNW